VTPEEKADVAGGFRGGVNVPAGEEGFDLGGDAEGFAIVIDGNNASLTSGVTINGVDVVGNGPASGAALALKPEGGTAARWRVAHDISAEWPGGG